MHRVEILDAAIVGLAHQTLQLRAKTEDTYLQTLAMQDDVWLHDIHQRGAGEIVVAANYRELRHLEETHHVVDAKVKLMVADGSRIVFHLIHESYLHIALEERIIRRALREVAAVEKQQIRIHLALLLNHRHTAKITTTIRHRRIGEVRIDRHHARMGVVRMQHHQLFLRHHVHGTEAHHYIYY